ncbi:DUF4397 domain-containing protein [Inconstantimicrobium porci]|uniref:DUF4397 domain-containing protein n=1 Tax=Inconstantimicrobium porci TaxID=2652291 RepID=A0A7X2MX12_9CLOT|nr:DUF4397 domain-containing protein [Inconstantimicrobium porci]MDD6769255.1 DUF4397 domain-containing protein [Inconstantimicrobium porci]MSR90653.1 DUF4397 domain-containing protein [Inconstantimicrobium porci]
MYPDKKYMEGTDAKDLNFAPLSSEILNQLYNPTKNINFFTPVIMKEPFFSDDNLSRNTSSQSYIRFFHAAHSKNSIDIYINSQLIKKNINYTSMTSYICIPSGTYTIKLYKSGTHQNPILISNTKICNNNHYTFAIIENSSKISILMLKTKNKDTTSYKGIHVRFSNLVPSSPLLNVTIDSEQQLFNEIEYGETTSYVDLSPGIYSFEVFPKDYSLKKLIAPNVSLASGAYHTIFAIGRADLSGSHQLLIFRDI